MSGTLNVFEAARALGIFPRIQLAGSSEEYGLVLPEEVPVKETNPLRPLSPYAVSKVAAGLLGYQYCMSYGLHIVRTRAFNHTGPPSRGGFRNLEFRQAVVRNPGGSSRPGDSGRQPERRPGLHRRARHRPRLLAGAHPRDAGRSVQHLLGKGCADRRDAGHAGGHQRGTGRGSGGPFSTEALRRADVDRGLQQVPRSDRLGARDPLETDAIGPPVVLGGAVGLEERAHGCGSDVGWSVCTGARD